MNGRCEEVGGPGGSSHVFEWEWKNMTDSFSSTFASLKFFILVWQCSGLNSWFCIDRFWGPCEMLVIEPRLATCTASTFPAVLSFQPTCKLQFKWARPDAWRIQVTRRTPGQPYALLSLQWSCVGAGPDRPSLTEIFFMSGPESLPLSTRKPH